MARRERQGGKRDEQIDPLFIGSQFSNQELAFLIEHLGQPSELALPEGEDIPEGVNPTAVEPILDRTYRLQLMQKAAEDRYPEVAQKLWVGFPALIDICEKTLDWNATVQELKARTRGASAEVRRAANCPSLHLWDPSTDIPYYGGVGADADIVRTAIDGGRRVNLFTELRESGVGSIRGLGQVAKFVREKRLGKTAAPIEQDETEVPSASERMLENTPDELLVKSTGPNQSLLECPLCGFAQPFKTDSASSKKSAHLKMLGHLGAADTNKEGHKLLAKRMQSGRAGRGRSAAANTGTDG